MGQSHVFELATGCHDTCALCGASASAPVHHVPEAQEEQEYVYPQLVSDASMTRLCVTLICVSLLAGAVALRFHDDISGSTVLLILALMAFWLGF